MKLYIYKLGETIYEGDASSINLPGEDGELTILAHHIPIVTHLKAGSIHIKTPSGDQDFPILGGFAEVKPEKTILLVE